LRLWISAPQARTPAENAKLKRMYTELVLESSRPRKLAATHLQARAETMFL
jgi:hypothetical protein